MKINHDKPFKIYGKDTVKIVTGILINNNNIRVTRKYKRLLRFQLYNEIKIKNMALSQDIYGKLAFIRNVDLAIFTQMINYIENIGIYDKFKPEFFIKQI